MNTVMPNPHRLVVGSQTPGQNLAAVEQWLGTMRSPNGYGGPVVHWWQNCLQFTGAGLDWRYEGMITGFLNLYQRTQDSRWLACARQAGDDLVCGQLSSGNFRNSNFELNPYPGGTPHEAAAALGLLHLAEQCGEHAYLSAAERCLQGYYVAYLWDSDSCIFYDSLEKKTFVPNKAATLTEALFKLADLTGDEQWITDYALPTLEAVIAHQLPDGSIYQYSERGRPVAWFFPYYIARCVPALVEGHHRTGENRYLRAAQSALDFIVRWRDPDGGLPQVIYDGGRMNRYPRWIAGAGDIARALSLLDGYDPEPTLAWMLRGQMANGAFRTAHGFAVQSTQRQPPALPDFRDLLPVCGWVDKAFRYLTMLLPDGCNLPPYDPQPIEMDCLLRGRVMQYREDTQRIELRQGSRVIYRWDKGHPWAAVCDLRMLWS